MLTAATSLARSLAPGQLQALLVAALNLRLVLSADLIGDDAFAAELRTLLADPAAQPPLTTRTDCHATAARRIVRDLSTVHLQDALTHLLVLHAMTFCRPVRTDFFVRYALLQIDHLIEVATTAARTAEHIDLQRLLASGGDIIRRREREIA